MLLLSQGGICHVVGRVSLTRCIYIYIDIYIYIYIYVGRFGRLTYHTDVFITYVYI